MALKQLLTNLSDSSTPVDSSAYPTQASHLEGVTFNQRSFRFGEGRQSDRSGGGFSKEPFIGNPRALFGVDTNDSDLSDANDSLSGLENTLSIVDGVTDGLVRGGIVTALKRSLTDTQRLTNFYFSGRGAGFLLKQTLLQTTNPSIEDGGISILGLRRNRQFNFLGTNLLAQSLVNFSGVHFDRAGLLPIWPEDRKYEAVVRNKSNDVGHLSVTSKKTNTFEGNRLLTLLEDRIKPFANSPIKNTEANTSEEQEEKSTLGKMWDKTKDTIKDTFNPGDPMLYEYGAGPGSTYGIGRTSIRRFENTLNSPNFTNPSRLGDQFEGPIKAANVQNYLKVLGRPGAIDYQGDAGNGTKLYRESRIGTGNPGVEYLSTGRNPHISQDTYNVYDTLKLDKVNMLDIFKSSGNPDELLKEEGIKDFIKFRFEAIDNDNPIKSDVMVFRAFLDDLKDNYNANFNEFNYNGRGETFYTYNSFKRTINFNFKVAAQTRHEMMPLYRKLNYLVSQTAPEYKGGRMRAGFVRLTIGSLIDRIPGFISSVNLSWQKDYPWEIVVDSDEKDSMMLELPHVLDVSISFLPVHNFTPQRSITNSPFILPHENNGTLNEGQKWYSLDSSDTIQEALKQGEAKLARQFYGKENTVTTVDPIKTTYIQSPESQVTPQIIRSNTAPPPTQAEIQQQQDQQLEDEANRYGTD